MFKLRKNKKGFTLVELMVVVVIIGILTAIAIPVYNSVTTKAKVNTVLANQRTVDSAIMAYNAGEDKQLLGTENITILVPKYLAADPNSNSQFGEKYKIGTTADGAVVCVIELADGVELPSGVNPDDIKLHK